MKPFFMKNYRKKKINYCYGFMLGNFQVICGSMVGKHCCSPASTETPVIQGVIYLFEVLLWLFILLQPYVG